MLKIGITGGIGSGKSTVCQVFETLGIPVFYADAAAKKVMEQDTQVRQQVIEAFGQESYLGQMLNRPYLAHIVFNNPQKLAQLNAISHPATIAYGAAWMAKQQSPYILKEAALFFETGSHQQMDKIIGVSAPLELRIHRTMLRDNINEKVVLERISTQMDQDEKMSLCDFVLYNDDNLSVIEQVLYLHQNFLSLSSTANIT